MITCTRLHHLRYWVGTLLIIFFTTSAIQAQWEIQLPAGKYALSANKVPFNQVLVIDNRINKPIIAIEHNGMYPFLYTYLAPSCPVAITDYINTLITSLPKGNQQILINLEQLRVQNTSPRKLLFMAGVFVRNRDSTFSWLFTEDKLLPVSKDGLGATIAAAFTHLIEGVARFKQGVHAEASHTLSEINIPALTRWQQYPAAILRSIVNGGYNAWDDFRESTPTQKRRLGMVYRKKGGTWVRKGSFLLKWFQAHPFVVANESQLYIRYQKNKYLPLRQERGVFSFTIPDALPDLFTRLSLESLRKEPGAYFTEHTADGFQDKIGNSDNTCLVDAITCTACMGISILGDWIYRRPPAYLKDEILSNASTHNLNTGYVDMESGDFLYELEKKTIEFKKVSSTSRQSEQNE